MKSFFYPIVWPVSVFNEKDQKTLDYYKTYIDCFKNYEKPDELWAQIIDYDNNLESSDINGIACSPGSIEAQVSVVHHASDIDKIIPGSILITKFVDPAWTLCFDKIGGLITETGGVLSHGAVIAREYNIPAVLAVKNGLSRLAKAKKVRINGSTGNIQITEAL